MLRCITAHNERQLQAIPWQAVGLMQQVCLGQQLPSLLTSLCQQQAAHTSSNAAVLHSRRHTISPSQLTQYAGHEGPRQPHWQQHSESQTSAAGPTEQQLAAASIRRQSKLSCPTWQQLQLPHCQLQQRVYSSMSAGHAHYHARHSGMVMPFQQVLGLQLIKQSLRCGVSESALMKDELK
jgi:hypothetical protein